MCYRKKDLAVLGQRAIKPTLCPETWHAFPSKSFHIEDDDGLKLDKTIKIVCLADRTRCCVDPSLATPSLKKKAYRMAPHCMALCSIPMLVQLLSPRLYVYVETLAFCWRKEVQNLFNPEFVADGLLASSPGKRAGNSRRLALGVVAYEGRAQQSSGRVGYMWQSSCRTCAATVKQNARSIAGLMMHLCSYLRRVDQFHIFTLFTLYFLCPNACTYVIHVQNWPALYMHHGML